MQSCLFSLFRNDERVNLINQIIMIADYQLRDVNNYDECSSSFCFDICCWALRDIARHLLNQIKQSLKVVRTMVDIGWGLGQNAVSFKTNLNLPARMTTADDKIYISMFFFLLVLCLEIKETKQIKESINKKPQNILSLKWWKISPFLFRS